MAIHPETKKELNRQEYQWHKLQRYKDNPKNCIMDRVPKMNEPFYYYHLQQCKFHSYSKTM